MTKREVKKKVLEAKRESKKKNSVQKANGSKQSKLREVIKDDVNYFYCHCGNEILNDEELQAGVCSECK